MDKRVVAQKIFLGFTEKEWETVDYEFSILEKDVEFLNSIDTEGVESMDLPFEVNENSLRIDDEGFVLKAEDVVLNAADKENNMVKIVKVVG